MAMSRIIELSEDERFSLWGRRISSIKLPTETVGYGDWVSLRAHDGYVGSVTPGQVAEVANALNARRRLVFRDESGGQS